MTNLQIRKANLNFDYWETKDSDGTGFRVGIGSANTDEMDNLIQWVSLRKESKTNTLVLYADRFTQKIDTLLKDQIIGVQYYYVVDSFLMHKFYFIDGGKPFCTQAFTGASSGINYNDRADIYRLYFQTKYPRVFALGISDWSTRFKKGKNNFVSDAIEKMMGEPN